MRASASLITSRKPLPLGAHAASLITSRKHPPLEARASYSLVTSRKHPPLGAMHYPQLVSTTCVSAGMIAIGVVLNDWPGGSALLQPCR
ncbi:MAG TPA: hypothetical protein DEF43_17040, partial [Chloroflexus aurantiacus]|nr:hypothetical protein [Chloroflexus aurantiacus]